MTPTDPAKNDENKQIIYVPAFPDLPHGQDDDEIDLFELWNIIWGGKWFIAGFTLACTLIAVYVTLFVLPVTFKSEAVLMPTDTGSGIMSQLAGLASSLPIPINLPGNGKTNAIMDFLNSRNLQERLITKYDLLPRIYKNLWDPQKKKWLVDNPKKKPTVVLAIQREALKNSYQVSQDQETNLITIDWVDQDPVFAAKMLDRVIAELQHYLNYEYETDAKREREFVQNQLDKATTELEHWEQAVPGRGLTQAKIERERAAEDAVYTELRQQLELAKIAEAKQTIRFKVLDAPFVPEQRYKPKRALICALTLVLSGILAVFLVLGFHRVRNREERR